MVVFLTYEITTSAAVAPGWQAAVLFGAACTAVGIEIVGILAGHSLEGYWRIGDTVRALLAFALLALYVMMTVYMLRHNPTLLPVPVIAAILYLVAALADGLHTATDSATDEATHRRQVADEQRRAAMELDAELRREAQRQRHEVALLKAQLQAQPSTQPSATPAQPAQVAPQPQQFTPAQLRVLDAIKRNPGATDTQLGEQLGISRQAVAKHKTALNGAAKEVTI
jgi:DNA-binding CsgD family transcriptional regulator